MKDGPDSTRACPAGRFSNGLQVLNATPHPLTFLDGDTVVEIPPSGARLDAAIRVVTVGRRGPAFLETPSFLPTPAGLAELAGLERAVPGALIIGSLVSAQAYPGRVFSMVPAPGFERVPPVEKRMSIERFTVFPAQDRHRETHRETMG